MERGAASPHPLVIGPPVQTVRDGRVRMEVRLITGAAIAFDTESDKDLRIESCRTERRARAAAMRGQVLWHAVHAHAALRRSARGRFSNSSVAAAVLEIGM